MRAIICSFSGGIDEMKRKDQKDALKVLRVLAKAGRYSVFEVTENDTIAKTVTNLHHKSLTYNGKKYGVMLALDCSMGYPWTKVVLTDAAKQLLADYPEMK